MTQNTDITCEIIKEKDYYKVTWSPEGPLPVSTKHLSYNLPHTEKLLLGDKEMSKIEFTIFSSGRIFPAEKISFISPSQEKKVFIDLIYPKYLQNTESSSYFSFIPLFPKKKNEKRQ
jgi:hypothetical protein